VPRGKRLAFLSAFDEGFEQKLHARHVFGFFFFEQPDHLGGVGRFNPYQRKAAGDPPRPAPRQRGARVSAVVPPLPPAAPTYAAIWTGPGELGTKQATNLVIRPILDRQIDGKPAVREWGFSKDAGGRFDGVIDVFGDGPVWAAWVPVLVFYVCLLVFAGWFVARLPTGFIPALDRAILIISIQLPPGASLGRTDAVVRQATDIALKVRDDLVIARRIATCAGVLVGRGDRRIRTVGPLRDLE